MRPSTIRLASTLNCRSRLVAALDQGIGSGYGDAARERDRLLLVGVGAAAASVTALDFAAERVPRLRVGFALVFGSASAETGAARVAAGATCAFGLRPSPSCFAIVERCSE